MLLALLVPLGIPAQAGFQFSSLGSEQLPLREDSGWRSGARAVVGASGRR